MEASIKSNSNGWGRKKANIATSNFWNDSGMEGKDLTVVLVLFGESQSRLEECRRNLFPAKHCEMHFCYEAIFPHLSTRLARGVIGKHA